MVKICFIQKELKDKNFLNSGEKINFQILKALCDSSFFIDIYCIKNYLSKKYAIENITELAENNFYEKALALANNADYDLTFGTDLFPADIVYVHKHTAGYLENVVKSKIEALYYAIFKREKYLTSVKILEQQKKYVRKNKIILTPSIILKNDLINTLHADGQNVYILPPSTDVPKKVNINLKDIFTFGFLGNDFMDNGGFILLKALSKINDFNFKLKLVYPCSKIPNFISLYLKHSKLESKVEFIDYPDDMNEFYGSIDCLIVPSKKESFGLPVLEAMSRGKIVIVSSRCGAKDIIEHDNNGLIFDVTKNPVNNLVKILKYILVNKNDFESMRQKAVYTASVYNNEKFSAELIRIINKYLEKTRGE